MENTSYSNFKTYTDLIKDNEDVNAWTSEDCFPVQNLNPLQKDLLANVNVIEVIFPGTQGDRNLSEIRFETFENFVSKYVLNNQSHPYFIKIEHTLSKRNRIRSYKGIIPKGVDEKDYIELELDMIDDYSLITAIMSIKESNVSRIFDSFYDSTNCFILLTSKNVLSTDFLKDFYKKHVLVNKTTSLNYVSLAIDFCRNDAIVIRAAGDGGDNEINLQIFFPITEKEKIINSLSIGK